MKDQKPMDADNVLPFTTPRGDDQAKQEPLIPGPNGEAVDSEKGREDWAVWH